MKPLTTLRRNLYRVGLVVCVIDMAIIAKAIHEHDDWVARGSMVACVLIAFAATYRLRQKVGVEA